MEIPEILQRLERASGRFEREAIEAAVARREEITPELLRVLEETVEHAGEIAEPAEYMAHIYAMFLLAQFRETRAYPLVLRIALLPSDLLRELCGDFAADGIGRVLASVCGDDVSGIQGLIENEDANQWVRCAALEGLVTLVAAGVKDRDEMVAYFGTLLRGKLSQDDSHVWSALANCSADLYPAELMEDIGKAYEDGLIDPDVVSTEDFERELAKGKEQCLEELRAERRLVEDTAAEMQWWACFQEDRLDAGPIGERLPEIPRLERSVEERWEPLRTVRRAGAKVGRNDRCPCGSGKKHKKCCGA